MKSHQQRDGWINLACLVIVNIFWAAQYPAYKFASNEMGSAALNFWTLLFASLLLIPLWLRTTGSASRKRRFEWNTLGHFAALGLLGIIPPSVMLSWGISHSSASNAAILSLTIPILMLGLGVLMLGETLTPLRASCLIVGVIGTLLMSLNDLRHFSLSQALLIGNVVILIGGLGSAFYNVYSKKLLSRHSELEILLYSYAVGAIACALISSFFEMKPFYIVKGYSNTTWLALAVLGFLSWGIAMILWMWVLNRLEVGQISSSIYLLLIFGLLLSVVTVHDRIDVPQILGGLPTVSGTVALTFFDRVSSKAAVDPTNSSF